MRLKLQLTSKKDVSRVHRDPELTKQNERIRGECEGKRLINVQNSISINCNFYQILGILTLFKLEGACFESDWQELDEELESSSHLLQDEVHLTMIELTTRSKVRWDILKLRFW